MQHWLPDTVLIIMWQELQCESKQTKKTSFERGFRTYNLQDTNIYGKAACIITVSPHVSLSLPVHYVCSLNHPFYQQYQQLLLLLEGSRFRNIRESGLSDNVMHPLEKRKKKEEILCFQAQICKYLYSQILIQYRWNDLIHSHYLLK